MKKLKHFSHELDDNLGSILSSLEILKEIKTLFLHLRHDMDEAVYNGKEMFYYREHHRMVIVLSELCRYTMIDIWEDYQKAAVTRDETSQ